MNRLCHPRITQQKTNPPIFSNAHLKQIILHPTHITQLNKNKSADVLALESATHKKHYRKLTTLTHPISHHVYATLTKRIQHKHINNSNTQIYEIFNDTIIIRPTKSNSTFIANNSSARKHFINPIIRNRSLLKAAHINMPVNDRLNTSLLKSRRVGAINKLGFV